MSLQQLQTPKNQQNVQKALEDLGSTAREATKKIGKAVMVFHARALLAEKESKELLEETKKMQEAASRKRKRVPGSGPQLIGAVLESLEQLKEGGGRVTRQRAAKQQRRSPLIIEVKTEDEGLEDLEESDLSDVSDCIVIVYDN